MLYTSLNPEKALVWRITHRQNLEWILSNGIHTSNSIIHSPNWITIGNVDLISRRATRKVPVVPEGTLSDYVPFYFTPFSPMMYNIHTGRGGVKQVNNSDIVILVSSLHKIAELQIPYAFTDRHAYPVTANYYNSLESLNEIDWQLLQHRNFIRDPNDPEKVERYQAEALVYNHMPVNALLGVVCYTEEIRNEIQILAQRLNTNLNIRCIPDWYF